MAENTSIEWADHTMNPWLGCTKVSTGPQGACEHCYAEAWAQRYRADVTWGGPGLGVGKPVRTAESTWKAPLAWNRRAEKDGTRPFVFCASLADVFDNAVPAEWRRDLIDLIRETPNLTWLLLTKRPQNIVKLFVDATMYAGAAENLRHAWPRNAAIGCTVVTQEEADRDVPVLLAAKAALKPAFAFLSMEPLLGPVDLRWIALHPGAYMQRVDWVITGGETDQGAHKARPSHSHWFRQIRDACATAGVAYHHKQNGEWVDHFSPEAKGAKPDGNLGIRNDTRTRTVRVGKARAGRLLDGVEHNARPVVAPIQSAQGALL